MASRWISTNRNILSLHRIMKLESESGRLTFNLMEFVGYRLRQFRTAYAGGKGISQEALAKAVGVSTNTISRWETATYKPTVDDLQKLALFFERSIVEFFPKYEALTTVEEHVDALARKARKLPGEVVKQLYEYVEFLEYVHGDRDDSEARRLMRKTKKAKKTKLSGKRKAAGT